MRSHGTQVGAVVCLGVFVLFLGSLPAWSQTGTLFVEGNNVGVGVATPTAKLHVQGTDGTTEVLVQELSPITAARTLYRLQNNGVTAFQLFDASASGSRWNFEAEGPSMRFNKAGSGGDEMVLRNRLDSSGLATLTVNGSVQATNVSFTSSREAKTGFEPIAPQDVLAKVVAIPITEWKFKDEQNGRRHLGPVAEDFNAAFGLSDTTSQISLIDASGVALASIQGLSQIVSEKQAAIDELQAQNAELQLRIEKLEAAVAALTDSRP